LLIASCYLLYFRRRDTSPAAMLPKPSSPTSGSGDAVCGSPPPEFEPDPDWLLFDPD
jgi:hypothetical protein